MSESGEEYDAAYWPSTQPGKWRAISGKYISIDQAVVSAPTKSMRRGGLDWNVPQSGKGYVPA